MPIAQQRSNVADFGFSSMTTTPLAECKPATSGEVGNGWRRVSRRAGFVWRFIFWTVRHRSWRNAAWIAEFEGHSW